MAATPTYPMHELSIAVALVDEVCAKAAELGVRVEVVHVRVGELSGVVEEALAFSFDAATADTPIAGARLEIERVPVTVLCPACGGPKPASPQQLRCPDCGAPTPQVVGGRELELYALEVTDERSEDATAHRRGPSGDPQEERPAGG